MPKNGQFNKRSITVIGGGAAGMAAAITAARIAGGASVRIIEKNDKTGRKILATGNGRCNLMNALCTAKDFKNSDTDENRFAEIAFSRVGLPETKAFFEGIGVMLREESEGRIYPYSEQASSVQEVLQAEANALGVEICCRSVVKSLERQGGGFAIRLENGFVMSTDLVILATGGKAGIQYGSAGEGYAFAKALSHTVYKPIPALAPLLSEEPLLEPLKGVRVKGAVTLLYQEKELDSETGEIQFTGDGISGICVFNLCRSIRLKEGECYCDFSIRMDFLPELSEEMLYQTLLKRKESLPARKKEDFLTGMVQKKLALVIFKALDEPLYGPAGEWNEDFLKKLAHCLKGWEVALSGTKGWKEAQVTSGGVAVSEINPDTMESKLVQNLYFAGEIMDIDGKCGGYNLQWAWTSGLTAGSAAACYAHQFRQGRK